MKAFVLAAGFGTRLRPLSLERAKPAWPLFDIPLAAHVLERLKTAGVDEVVVNLHHLAEPLRRSLTPWIPAGLRVHWSPEVTILGTGGALAPWRNLLSGGAFFVANADTYQETDLLAMLGFHQERKGLATLALHRMESTESAPIETDADGRIVRFLKARAPGSEPGRPCGFTGIHILEPEILERLPRGPSCINADLHAGLIAAGAPVFGYTLRDGSFWSDLGTVRRYLQAHQQLLGLGRVPAGAPGRVALEDETKRNDGRVLAPSYLGQEVRVGRGSTIGPFAVVGDGAWVGPRTRVERSVLWPRARVAGGALQDSVVSPSGQRMVGEPS